MHEAHSISASFDTLLKQAPMTAHSFMVNARNDIDEMFGDGYAAAHPELMAAYMNAAAVDLHGATLGKVLPAALESIADAIRDRD